MNASGAINATDKNYVSGWITTGPTAPDCFEFYGEYVYDALGRRIRATADGVTTYFYYDGQNVVAEYDRDLDLLRYYVHGSTYIDERAILHDAVNDEEYYYALRELYTVEALLNNRAHEVERYTYDAYGRPTINILSVYDVDFDGDVDWRDHDEIGQYEGSDPCGNAGPIYDTNGDGVIDYTDQPSGPPYPPGIVSSPTSGVGNPYAFTGRRLDHFDNFGLLLYHYRAREYDPFHGRFLQRDPAEYVDGGNLYEYATSSPLRYHDPLGTQIIESFDHFKDFAPSWTGPPKVKGRVFTYQPPFGSGLTFSYFYDFYNGSHPNRKNPKITDAVIVLGSFTDAIRSQSQVLDYEDLTVD
ncbi:MAG: hypothetical protein GY778_11955 [bacterium]|nr:hypothetical protein [bacterium]